MRFTIFKSRAFSASIQPIGFIVGGIALTFHFSSSSAQEAGIEAESKAAIAVDNNKIANAIKDRKKHTGRQLFEHTWEWSINPPEVNKASHRESRLSNARVFDVANGDGLGPLYNAKSCLECHVSGGGSDVKHNVILITLDPRVRPHGDHEKFAARLRQVFPGFIAPGGVLVYNTIVHNFSTRPGYDEIRDRLATHVDGGIEPEWFAPDQRTRSAIARQPVIAGRYLDIDFYLSQRNSPPLFGLGLINKIAPQQLAILAEQQASKSGGKITGRVAGKFGWQGQSSSLLSFVESACAGELGLNQESLAQTPDHADHMYVNPSIDILPDEALMISSYISTMPRPLEDKSDTEMYRHARAGERIFNSVGCVDCHVSDIRPATGLFSDLLLHDMGERLQGPSPSPIGLTTGFSLNSTFKPETLRIKISPRARIGASSAGYYQSTIFGDSLPSPYMVSRPDKPQFPRVQANPSDMDFYLSYATSWDAMQREWKTPPLWGVRDSGPYLHDGRASTIEEAIEWHGGESEDSRVAFNSLSRHDKDLVVIFLNSLQAPRLPEEMPS